MAEFCQLASLGRKLPSEKSGKCCELGTKPASLFFVADCYGRTMATIFDNDVANIEEEEEEQEEEEEEDDEEDDDDDDEETFVVPDFIGLARNIQNRSSKQVGTPEVEKRRFKEFFGASLEVVEILWEMLYERDFLPDNSQPKHLLWTCYFLKVYPKQETGCSAVGGISGAISPKTMKHWVWDFIERIGELVDDVVSTSLYITIYYHYITLIRTIMRQTSKIIFESRLNRKDILNDCTMSIDGTDFRIPQQGKACKGNPFASHKYAGKSALRYELGIDILEGNLVWIQGPYPAGKFNDIAIFNKVLRHYLEPWERVEADNGYVGHGDKIKCPKNVANPPENLKMQGRVRARHETLNGRLKNWGILSQTFRHDISLHGSVFHACAVITQLMIDNGEPLFNVEYNDEGIE